MAGGFAGGLRALVRRCAGAAMGVLLLSGAPAAAQASETPATLESYKLNLDQLESATARDGLSNEALLDIRARIAPIRDGLRAKAEQFEPKLAEITTRLNQLGQAPEQGAPAEDPAIAAERADLNKLHREIDAALKQARLLSLRSEQINERIVDKRRAIFARELLHRSVSIAAPAFWAQIAEALPQEVRSLGFLLRSWSSYALENGGKAGLVGAALATLAILVGIAALLRLKPLRQHADPTIATRFGRALAALAVLARRFIPAPLAVTALLWAFDAFRLMPERMWELAWGLVIGALVASLGRGVALAVFAPDQPGRRLVGFGDRSARALANHLTFGMRVLGAAIFLNIMHKAIVAPVALTVGTSAALALAIAGILIHLILKLRATSANADEPSRLPWARFIGWIVSAAIIALLLTGHIGLAAFIAGRLLTLAATAGALYILLVLADSLFTDALAADTPGGRALAALLGLKPRTIEVIGLLTSAALRIGLVLAALFLVMGPWGILAADFFGALEGAVFGFKIGEITVSLSAIFGAAAVLLIGLALTRALQRWLQTEFLPRTGIEPSLQLSIATIIGYIGFIAAVALGLSELGIDLQKIALVAGALSVGIGFGLQSIVSNFVSGLILLAERPIRVGDSIVVKGEEGYVKRISVRATEIETFERASVIVPNSELITGVVKNWTHANTTGRIIIKIGVAYDSDAEGVRELLLAAAHQHPQVLQTPPPRVFLMGFGESALEFELRCVVANIEYALAVKSDLHFAILGSFRQAGIEIPYPQREVRVYQERPAATLLTLSKSAAARASEG